MAAMQMADAELFGDLDGVERGALAQVVGDHPQRQAVLERRIVTAAAKHGVPIYCPAFGDSVHGLAVAEGRLRWDAPPGSWTILRYVCMVTGEKLKVPSPASDGLASDHLNAEATRDRVAWLRAQVR